MAVQICEQLPDFATTGRLKNLWWQQEGNQWTVGIDWSADIAGCGVFCVELPEVDEWLDEGCEFASIHTLNTTLVLTTPFAGRITHINDHLDKDPSTLESENRRIRWLVKLKKH